MNEVKRWMWMQLRVQWRRLEKKKKKHRGENNQTDFEVVVENDSLSHRSQDNADVVHPDCIHITHAYMEHTFLTVVKSNVVLMQF